MDGKTVFRSRPDFVLLKADVGAGQFLVSTGEKQSTNHPDVQNSIYAVGSPLESNGRPIVCVTMLKSKHAQLSVAKISSLSHATEPVVGAVSLKYIVSPAPMDLSTLDGMNTFSTRLFHVITEVI